MGCGGSHKNSPQPSYSNLLQLLQEKTEKYLNLQTEVFDQDGWILTGECDALLHNSLAKFGGADISLKKARDDNGRMWRRPARDCLESGGSRSTISRDMLLGYLLVLIKEKKIDEIENLIEYGEERGWIMGEHDGSLDGYTRVYATPAFQALWYQARKSLGGDGSLKASIPQSYGACDGYTCHLQALTILARGIINNGLTDAELERIQELRNEDKNNALFWAISKKFDDGNQDRAVRTLLRSDLFPQNRLPNAYQDHCSPYLFMHGENQTDWSPCDRDEVHPGHDLTFVSAIIFEDSYGLSSWNLIGHQ